MFNAKDLAHIVKLAVARRTTLIKRLEKAQYRQDNIKCDMIYSQIARENELIENATRDLARITNCPI